MKSVILALVMTLLVTSPAVGAVFSLAPFYYYTGNPAQDAPFSNAGMVVWRSPADGIINISGNAWPTYSIQSVWVYYIPSAYANDLNPDSASLYGYSIANGAVQYPYQDPQHPAQFGVDFFGAVPWRTYYDSNWTVNGHVEVPTPGGYTPGSIISGHVNAGDVIVGLTEQWNLFVGDTAGLNVSVQLAADFQQAGQPGTLTNPQFLTGVFNGISGSLKPSDNHLSDAYEVYWAGGDFAGSATTNCVYQALSGVWAGSGGFQSGLALALYSVGSPTPLASETVLGASSSCSDTFDLGSRSAGNYVLLLTDLNSNDDPPYSLQFNSPLAAPSTVPEPGTILLLGTGLTAMIGTIRRKLRA